MTKLSITSCLLLVFFLSTCNKKDPGRAYHFIHQLDSRAQQELNAMPVYVSIVLKDTLRHQTEEFIKSVHRNRIELIGDDIASLTSCEVLSDSTAIITTLAGEVRVIHFGRENPIATYGVGDGPLEFRSPIYTQTSDIVITVYDQSRRRVVAIDANTKEYLGNTIIQGGFFSTMNIGNPGYGYHDGSVIQVDNNNLVPSLVIENIRSNKESRLTLFPLLDSDQHAFTRLEATARDGYIVLFNKYIPILFVYQLVDNKMERIGAVSISGGLFKHYESSANSALSIVHEAHFASGKLFVRTMGMTFIVPLDDSSDDVNWIYTTSSQDVDTFGKRENYLPVRTHFIDSHNYAVCTSGGNFIDLYRVDY